MRSPDASAGQLILKYPDNNNLLVLKLDVTNTSAICDAFKAAKDKYGRIDIVFNNAGSAILGEFEGTPEDKARALFDVRPSFSPSLH
jgi:NADP-dependent 3-hydroxy acid dehydrogenase YdfG